jgi:hypothetical protein
MYKELAGTMDIKISHELSKRDSIRRDTVVNPREIDILPFFKIEIRNSNVKGVQ